MLRTSIRAHEIKFNPEIIINSKLGKIIKEYKKVIPQKKVQIRDDLNEVFIFFLSHNSLIEEI